MPPLEQEARETLAEKLRSALRFAASRSAITAADEQAIIAAWNILPTPAPDDVERVARAIKRALCVEACAEFGDPPCHEVAEENDPNTDANCNCEILSQIAARACLSSVSPTGWQPTNEQIKHMVDRFLTWPLPDTFNPDAGISFDPVFNKGTKYEMRHRPSGTNLFGASEAEAMVRHMIADLPSPPGEQPVSLDREREEPPIPCAVMECLWQYESDLQHPPEGDSRERRLERVRKVIATCRAEVG